MSKAARRQLVLLAAVTVAVLAGVVYRSTMLGDLDLGDTPSFQTMGGSTFIGPRDAYPLYFAFGMPFVWAAGDPALGMNFASVAAAALACGALVLLALELSGSLGAALAAAVTFASTFTFWSQAVTTEVYALHILCIILSLLALLAWERQPSRERLTLFLLVYATSFGNHLTMVLLLPGVLLMLASAPGGGRRLLTWRYLTLAGICTAAGAAPYLWNIRTMALDPMPPQGFVELVQRFWFDVTKVDWRDTMILQVPESMADERWRMFVFDLRQQFAWPSLLLAGVGVGVLLRQAPRRFILLACSYVAFTAFALTYSVGDAHVFLLPGHLLVAVATSPALMWLSQRLQRRPLAAGSRLRIAPAAVALVLAGYRLYDEYPALDRSADRRARQTLDALAGDLNDRQSLLVADMDWQLLNGLNYYANRTRSDLAALPLVEVLPYLPRLIADNEAVGRRVFVTEAAAGRLQRAYGPLFELTGEAQPRETRLSTRIAGIPEGSRYVLCVLKPTPGVVVDTADISAALSRLTGSPTTTIPAGDYVAIAGIAGRAPELVHGAEEPFRLDLQLDGLPVHIRMDAWLAFDTIRRMGFGQVIAGRHHSLIVERGVSLVAIDGKGRPVQTEYADGLYAPVRRVGLTLAGP